MVRRRISRPAVKLLAMLGVLLVIGAGIFFVSSFGGKDRAQRQFAQRGSSSSRPAAQAQNPIPVMAAVAAAKDFPIIIRGIGTIQAFNTVTVKSRVDGNITKIAFREGQAVKTGDLLVQIDSRPYQAQLEQAEANKAKDQANLENARRDLDRLAALLQTQLAATRQQYDTQKATVDQLTAAVQADQAVIDAAKLNVTYSSITSPIDGITGLRLVDIGNLVTASAASPLVTVTQIKPIYAVFTIPERDLDRVRAVMARRLVAVLAFDSEDDKQVSQGTLQLVNNTVDQATGAVTLKAEFPNTDGALWPGQFINAHLVLDIVRNGVTVPSAAVQMSPSGPFVYAVRPDFTVESRPIKVTQIAANTALIGQGVTVGDKVVVSGQTGLNPGAKVVIAQGTPGEMNTKEPEIGPEGVGSTGVTTAPAGAGGTMAR